MLKGVGSVRISLSFVLNAVFLPSLLSASQRSAII